jgi:hypothetical protein
MCVFSACYVKNNLSESSVIPYGKRLISEENQRKTAKILRIPGSGGPLTNLVPLLNFDVFHLHFSPTRALSRAKKANPFGWLRANYSLKIVHKFHKVKPPSGETRPARQSGSHTSTLCKSSKSQRAM